MKSNYFKSIRRSYTVNILFSAVLSNLMAFGQPLQQIISDKESVKIYTGAGYSTYKGNTDTASGYPKQTATANTLVNNIPADTNQLHAHTAGYHVFFAGENSGIIGNLSGTGDENPDDNYFTVLVPQNINLKNQTAVLAYDVYGVQNADHTTKSINHNTSYGGRVITTGNNWISVSEFIPENQLVNGVNEIFFNRRTDVAYQYQIKNLRIEFQPKADNDFILTQKHVTNYNGKIYLSGITSGKKIVSINAGDKQLSVNNGFLEQVLTNISKDTHSLEISCTGINGEIRKTKYNVIYQPEDITHYFTESILERNISEYSDEKIKAGNIHFENSLTISNICSDNSKSLITAEGLAFKDIRTLNSDLTNVTGGKYKGYNIKKSGISGGNAVQLHLKYNPEEIPGGYTAKDIRTFYFDKNLRSWKQLDIDSLDYTNSEIITSIYDNDTDYINGIIKVPDSPESGSFAPTAITDMKVADPAAGVVSIAPPTPNSTGNATTSFPIKLPQGRNGMQPSLEVTYSSEAGNGWMGIGWNLSTPAITVNTKWGVPRFDGNNESELYSLNGADLVLKVGAEYTNPLRHNSNISRNPSDKEFYQRKESAYNKIIRHGNSPSNCWWEVIDKQGNKSYYGTNLAGTQVDDSYVIRNDNNNIVHWALSKTTDPYGNTVEYTYTAPTSVIATTESGLPINGKAFYPLSIEYTKGNSTANYYKVLFELTDRQDITTDYRNRYVRCDNKLLTRIRIVFTQSGQTDQLVRRYDFNYATKAFQKWQLAEIAEYDSSEQLFYNNKLEYYDYDQPNLFNSTSASWSSAEDGIGSGLSSLGAAAGIIPGGSILGTSTSSGFSVGGRGGAGFGLNLLSIKNTIGVSGNYSKNTQETKISFIDINGDGLPDKVFKKGDDEVWYRPNMLTASQTPSNNFGIEIRLKNISSIGSTKSNTYGGGIDGNVAGFGVGKSKSETKSETDSYFTDFNGDGLPDMVKGNRVLFNGTDADNSNQDTSLRNFNNSSAFTENPVVAGTINGDAGVVQDLQLPSMDQLRQQHPQFDHVKVWEAPFDGNINIKGIAYLIYKNGNNTNGFKITVENKKIENTNSNVAQIVGAIKYLSTVYTGGATPASGNSSSTPMERTITNVKKGDLVFFRVHNRDYGSGGTVQWNPEIEYYSFTETSNINIPVNSNDDNGKNVTSFKSDEDFIVQNGGSTNANTGNSVTIGFNITTLPQLTDDVTFTVKRTRVKLDDGVEQPSPSIWTRQYSHINNNIPSGTVTSTYSGTVPTGYKDIYTFYAESPSNVRWDLINWKPTITSNGQTVYANVNYMVYDENVNQKKHWLLKSDLPAVGVINNSTDGGTTLMTLSHNFLAQDLSGMVNNLEDNTSVKVTWVVKSEEINSSGAIIFKRLFPARVFYVNKTTNGNYTVSGSPNSSVPLSPTLTTFNLTKQQIKNITDCPTGKLFSAFYVGNRAIAVNNATNITLTILQNQQANYFGYSSPKVINSPFFSLNTNKIGNTYRRWNEFLYNGGYIFPTLNNVVNHGTNPIDMAIFEPSNNQPSNQDLPDDFNPDNASAGDIEQVDATPRYMMYGQNTVDKKFVNKAIINSAYGNFSNSVQIVLGRFGEDNLYDLWINPDTFFNGQNVPNNQMFAIKQRSKSKGKAVSANGGIGIFNGSGTLSEAGSEVLNQYVDLNGDRYPDFISKSKIQFTNMQGGLSNLSDMSIGNGFITSDNNQDYTYGVSVAGIQPNSTKTANNSSRNKTVANTDSGINKSEGSSFDSKQWADINGDGLTDKIQINKNSIDVWLNKGYGFTDKIIWFYNSGVDLTTSWRKNIGTGANLSFGASFGVGFGAAISTANMGVFLADVTGDGLPELIYRGKEDTDPYKYYLNTGMGFAGTALYLISGTLDNDVSVSGNLFGTATYGFPINLLPPMKAVISGSGGGNAGVNEKKATLQDINGDGLPDVIISSSKTSLSVRYNNIGNTYLLKKVHTPLGGSWEVEYARTGNTYTMPNSKWVMTKITTNDGFNKDSALLGSPDISSTTVKYENPNYSRRERDFLGFGRVTVNHINADNTVYRYTVKEYHNENYYLSGAEKRSALYSQQNSQQPLTEQTTMYNLLDADNPVVSFNVNAASSYMQSSLAGSWKTHIDKSRLFLAPVRVVSSSYEGTNGLNATKEFLVYKNGNILEYLDRGESTDDSYKTVIDYYTAAEMGGVTNGTGFPKKISVYKKGNAIAANLMRQCEAKYHPQGKLSEVTTKLNNTENRIVSFTYNSFGNMTKYTDNDNKNASNISYWVDIAYDNVVNTYPTSVKNAFTEETVTVYNYLFGIPVLTTDPNSKKMRTRIDDRGRVVEVTGPNEMAVETSSAPKWTIRTEYKGEDIMPVVAPTTYVVNGKGNFQAGPTSPANQSEHFAVTKHFDPEIHPGSSTPTNQLVTISIVDGFGQPVQVKKSHLADGNLQRWIVTGLDQKDAFGRVIKSYESASQNYGTSPTTLDPEADKKYWAQAPLANEVITTYDHRDRILSVKQPGENNAAQVQYTIEENKFKQKQIDEKGNFTETFTDIRGRQRTVKQQGNIVTNFAYNAINELMMVIDNESKETRYTYDMAGRKTAVGHPDRGISSFTYNKVGQVTKQSTANLSTPPNTGLTINYAYDWTHLLNITYPLVPENNVKYIYGRKDNTNPTSLSATHNAIGRVIYQEDASGVQVFAYGNMGEVTKTLRSVAVPGSHPQWFLTQWQYDSWNRVQQISYPDFEVVNYNYNKAGALYSVTSNNLSGVSTPLPAIVSRIHYNSQGQRSLIGYGNGTETTYEYDVRQRLRMLRMNFGNSYEVNKRYEYDGVSNITGISTDNSTSAIALPGSLGGMVSHAYEYDAYNRLTHAEGGYTGRNDAGDPYLRHSYTLDMEYNTNHTIKKKSQTHLVGTSQGPQTQVQGEVPAVATSYSLDYSGYGVGGYSTGGNTSSTSYGWQQPHAVTKIKEISMGGEGQGLALPLPKERTYSYDASGNQVSVKQKEGSGAFITTRRNLWDEENRLMGVDLKPDDATAHPVAAYTYDAGGERIVRHNFDRNDVYSSGTQLSEGYKDNIMLYPSGLVMGKILHQRKRAPIPDELIYTKHYYIGAERIAARTGSMQQMGWFPGNQITAAMPRLGTGQNFPAPQGGQLTTAIMQQKTATAQTDATKYVYERVFDKLGVQGPALVNGTTPSLDTPGHSSPAANPILTYYFHPDHLGSSSYVTGNGGRILQHMEYLPFGEAMMDEHINSRNSPFKYNGKHLDEETGNYYYGARYYDPKLSNFISVDPLAEKTFSSYGYCYNNPVKFTDPSGMAPEDIYIDNRTGKVLGKDGASTDNIRLIDSRDFNDIKDANGGSTMSSEATAQLQNSDMSQIVTINEEQIQNELQNVNDMSRDVEHQIYIVLDRNNAEVKAVRGEPGTNGNAYIDSTPQEQDGVKYRTTGGNLFLGQAHGHPLTKQKGLKNIPGTSGDDVTAAKNTGGTIYSVDAYNTPVGGNAKINRVTSGGVQTNNVGTTRGSSGTGNFNMGRDALKRWSGF